MFMKSSSFKNLNLIFYKEKIQNNQSHNIIFNDWTRI